MKCEQDGKKESHTIFGLLKEIFSAVSVTQNQIAIELFIDYAIQLTFFLNVGEKY